MDAGCDTQQQHALHTIPGFHGPHPGIQLGTYVSHQASDEDLQALQQLAVPWAMVTVGDPAAHTADEYRRMQDRLAPYGLQIYRVANHSVHNVEEITLNLPGRDDKIEEFLTFIRNLGTAGIYYNTYAHMGNGIWSTGQTLGRGGVEARTMDLEQAKGHWNGKVYEGELTHGRQYSEEELGDNYEYFIRRVAPVAEEAGVFIGIHPDDPPVYPLGGVPRCIFGTFEGYRRALEIAESQPEPDSLIIAEILVDIGDWNVAFSKVGPTGEEYLQAWNLLGELENGAALRAAWFDEPSYVLRENPSNRGISAASEPGVLPGHVLITFDVTEFGRTTNVTVIEAVPPGLKDDSTARAINRSRFRPRIVDGAFVRVPGQARNFIFHYLPRD